MVVNLLVRYLGIPLEADSRRMTTWKPIIEKIEKRLSVWQASLISKVGRSVMIKFVINSLPFYFLGLFKMPNK